jgi:3-oxoacyl-[acyl-carrier protein] reductase
MSKEFADKVVLVTGGGKNIGRAIALSFAEGGATVAVNTRASREDAENVCGEIRKIGGKAAVFMADISDAAAVKSMVEGVVKQFGRLDVLVLNASVRREVPFLQMTFEEWRRPLSTTLDGAFHCISACAPHIIAAGGGSIVTLGGAEEGTVGKVHSSAAKSGLAGMVRALAKELAEHNVRVNVVSPGSINTSRPAHRSARPAVPGHIPLKRYGETAEIAATVRFLCSPGGGFITGQTIYANGGTVLGR